MSFLKRARSCAWACWPSATSPRTPTPVCSSCANWPKRWLKRTAAQIKANTLVDRDPLDDPDLRFKTQGGGFPRLDRIFDGRLLQTLDAFNDALWAQPAA